MAKRERPPLSGLSSDDDLERIRAYGLSRGFLPTDPPPPPPPAPPAAEPAPVAAPPVALPVPASPVLAPQPVVPAAPAPTVVRPAATRPWQAMFPDYLIEALRQAAAGEGTAQKVVVMRALRAAGFRVDDIDLQDLRRR